MGSGRDKRKKAKPKAAGHGDEKTAAKTERNAAKSDRRAAKKVEASPSSIRQRATRCMLNRQGVGMHHDHWRTQGGEDDLDALLKHFELADKRKKEVVVEQLPGNPSARLFASFTPVPGPVRTTPGSCMHGTGITLGHPMTVQP